MLYPIILESRKDEFSDEINLDVFQDLITFSLQGIFLTGNIENIEKQIQK